MKDRKPIRAVPMFKGQSDCDICKAEEVRELEGYTTELEKKLEDIRVSIHCHDKKFGFSAFTISLTQSLNK